MAALVIAHRGDCSRAHENTIDAVRDAIANGADMIEFDVRRTADGALVVHHDEAIGDVRLTALEYSSALARTLGLGYALPLLEEVLDATRGRVQLDVELKEAGYEAEVVDTIARRGFAVADFVVTSFDRGVVERMREIAPAVRTGLLVEETEWPRAIGEYRASGARFLAPRWPMLDERGLAAAEAHGVPLVAWTVNEPMMMRRLFAAAGVTGVITDRLATALHVRDTVDAVEERRLSKFRT